jgi:dihydroorotate dehydrogenase electron transfer subunit
VREAAARLGEAGLRCRLEVATEDGSRGPAEKVTDLLARHLRPGDRVVACGPEAMAKAVWQVCRAVPDVCSWFSLEAGMACGVGSCHGCAITLADGSYARVCHDGPVFGGVEVFGD